MEARNLALNERNITKTEVTLILGGVMLSRLIDSTLYYVEVRAEQDVGQIVFYLNLKDDLFIKLSVNTHKQTLKDMNF